MWRLQWPKHITDRLVTDKNPGGIISNSDLELTGGLLHLEALVQSFDAREHTILSKTDNLNTLFWQQAGNATMNKVPLRPAARLLGGDLKPSCGCPLLQLRPGVGRPHGNTPALPPARLWPPSLATVTNVR